MALALSDLRTLALDYLDDPNATYFTTAVMNMRLNLALKELQKKLISANQEFYSTCVYTTMVVDQSYYQLPADFLQILRLDYITQGSGPTAKTQKIYPMTPNQRDLLADTSGAPGFYYFSQNNFVLAPVPSTALTMHMEYSYVVANMVNDVDIPDCPDIFSEYIALAAARDCFLKDGRPTASIEGKLAQYETLLKQIATQREADGTRMVTMTQSMDWY